MFLINLGIFLERCETLSSKSRSSGSFIVVQNKRGHFMRTWGQMLGLLSLLVGCAASKSTSGNSMKPTIYYKPTVYYDDTGCAVDDLRDVKNPKGDVLITLCESDYAQCLMEGSCFVLSGGDLRSYNYHSTIGGVPRFIEVNLEECPFGHGVKNSCLDPYYTVAADLKFHKAGDVIFVPRLQGAKLPSGEIHDGFLVIRDSGGGIIGEHRFDFFTGFYNHLARPNTLARLGFGDPKNRFEYRKATEEEAANIRQMRNYPKLTEKVLHSGKRR